jgi:hypothetical protein
MREKDSGAGDGLMVLAATTINGLGHARLCSRLLRLRALIWRGFHEHGVRNRRKRGLHERGMRHYALENS